MLFKIKEFRTMTEYLQWLATEGDQIQVINMATLRKWNSRRSQAKTGDSGATYMVTYKEIKQKKVKPRVKCMRCGEMNEEKSRYCGKCGSYIGKPVDRRK